MSLLVVVEEVCLGEVVVAEVAGEQRVTLSSVLGQEDAGGEVLLALTATVNQENQFMNVVCFRSFQAFHFFPIHLILPNTKHDSSNLCKILFTVKRVAASLCGKLPIKRRSNQS